MPKMPFSTKRRIVQHPNTCPYCHSESLDADSPKIADNDEIKINVQCSDCHKEWMEIYRLVSAELIDSDEE